MKLITIAGLAFGVVALFTAGNSIAHSAGKSAPLLIHPAANDTTLWQIGRPDGSSSEFSDYPSAPVDPAKAQTVDVPNDWASRTDWKSVPKGLKGDRNPAVEIRYNLSAIPANGVMFSLKLIDAPKSGPQAAVFSNHLLAGILQLWGTSGTNSPYKWRKTYRLYIPKEMLHAGANTLRIETVRPMYSDSSCDPQLWWEWDYVKLDALATPAREPVHGTVAYIGTTLKQNSSGFQVDDVSVKMAPIVFPWLGIAYSGNTIRADYWYDLPKSVQPRRLEYLQALRDLNMTVLVDNVSGSHFALDKAGNIPDNIKAAVNSFFMTYGTLFQYYELGNEPCMFGGPGGYAEYVALAKYIDTIKPPTVDVTAPGWAYGGGKGNPINWDADPVRREQVEQYCQATNGHSYGYSYTDNNGGSFVQNLAVYKNIDDGWPKEYLNSETGTNNWHSEENGARFQSSQPKAEAFDRIMRAHVAVVDRTMQHALMFDDFGLFQQLQPGADLSTITVYPGPDGQDPRIKTFRRLALAYATHGAPLPYVYLNRDAVADKKVYFRAVDTSAIPGQRGSNAVSRHILLNFVNFESSAQTMTVRVTLPAPGVYQADRFGPGDTYSAAHASLSLKASPAVELTVTLGGGDSVQYILTPPAATRPFAPERVAAKATGDTIAVSWAACAGATRYQILRASLPDAKLTPLGETAANATSYADRKAVPGRKYAYAVVADNDAGASPMSDSATAVASVPAAPVLVVPTSGDAAISLSWDAVPTATGYQVWRSESVNGPFSNIGASSRPGYMDEHLANGMLYYYAVRAVNANGDGPAATAQCSPEAPPSPPAGLSAVAGDGRVVLRWAPAAGAISYVVRRSESARGPFDVVSSDVATNAFTDDGVANGNTYYYRVASKAIGAQGAFSELMVPIPEADPLPAPWKQADIGDVGAKGSASMSAHNGTMTVEGSGNNIWGTADSLHFVYQPLAGDGTLTAEIVSSDKTDPFATCGVMIRETLDPGSAMANMGFTAENGCGFPHRDKTAGECAHSGGPILRWVRISRKNNDITGSISADGQNWQTIATASIPMSQEVLIGCSVCSHVNSTLDKAIFSNVTVGK